MLSTRTVSYTHLVLHYLQNAVSGSPFAQLISESVHLPAASMQPSNVPARFPDFRIHMLISRNR